MKARKEKAAEDAGKAKAAAEAAEKEEAEKAEKEKGATAAVDAERKARQHVKHTLTLRACTPASAPRSDHWVRVPAAQCQNPVAARGDRQLVPTPPTLPYFWNVF